MTAPLHVFRVEHESDAKGPYCVEGRPDRLCGIVPNVSDPNHPMVRDERGGWAALELPEKRHGFRSLNQLATWFGRATRSYLQEEGYQIAVWVVPRAYVHDLPRQTVFSSTVAVRCPDRPYIPWEGVPNAL